MYLKYPKNTLIVDGVDISQRFHLILADGYTLEPPEPKTYTVDIPGGNGVIDLTEALSGDVSYDNRSMEFNFYSVDMDDYEKAKTELSNFLHGKAFDFKMTMDPDYTYHGRFTVSSYDSAFYGGFGNLVGSFVIDVDADPYKLKEHCSYKLNATGGKLFRLESGRKPVHPVIECSEPCEVTWEGNMETVPAGTYRLNNVVFRDGWNEIYINSHHFWNIKWLDIDETGDHPLTWEEASKYRWDDIQRLEGDYEDVERSWEELSPYRWSDVSSQTWDKFEFKSETISDNIVYLTYDWEDL